MAKITPKGLEIPSCRICLSYNSGDGDWDDSHHRCVPLIPNTRSYALEFEGGDPSNDRMWISYECQVWVKEDNEWIWRWPTHEKGSDVKTLEERNIEWEE